MSAVNVYSVGPLTLSVCAPKELSAEQVIADVEAQHPCGTTHGWHVSEDEWRIRTEPNQRIGEPTGRHGPIPCEQDAERLHWLLTA